MADNTFFNAECWLSISAMNVYATHGQIWPKPELDSQCAYLSTHSIIARAIMTALNMI